MKWYPMEEETTRKTFFMTESTPPNQPTDANLPNVPEGLSHIPECRLFGAIRKGIEFSNIVSIADVRGTITYVNDEFCRVSGYSREELI